MSEQVLFPVTVVGSWPRTRELRDALLRQQDGEIEQEEFERIADEAVEQVVRYQEDAGVDILSDGEQRRDNFYSFIVEKLEALVAKTDDHSTECNLSPITWQACFVASLFRPDGWPV